MAETTYMTLALEEARAAQTYGEVPVGAVVVEATTGRVLAQTANRVEQDRDPTGHAELLALRATARELGTPRLTECDLYVTLEPCAMCAQAIAFARIRRVIFGAYDPKGGGVEHGPRIFSQPTCYHAPEVIGGMEEAACAALLKEFFARLR